MRLLSQISRIYKNSKYEKFWIVIPSDLIKKLNWKKSNELKAEIKNNKLVIGKV